MLECVLNVSEGRDVRVIEALMAAAGTGEASQEAPAGGCLLDVHRDPHHHRAVVTLGGDGEALQQAVRAVATEAVRRIDLRAHVGVHPRLGALDVVPFVPLGAATLTEAVAARDAFADWAAQSLDLPCFLYGPERPLPEVRREAFRTLLPDVGPRQPHPTAGAVCVGARPVLVAYNLWLPPASPLETARRVAAELRGPVVRALGLDVGGTAQVSCNLLDPGRFGPAEIYDAVASTVPVARAELVGLVPESALARIPSSRWDELDLDRSKTIEYRLARLGHAGFGDDPAGGRADSGEAAVTPTPPPAGGTAPADGEDGDVRAR